MKDEDFTKLMDKARENFSIEDLEAFTCPLPTKDFVKPYEADKFKPYTQETKKQK